VISLTLSDGDKTPDQIGLFLSLVDINRWTRLRSLTLLDINDSDLQTFLLHITASCSLISLSIKFRLAESTETMAHFASTIAQPTLRRLDVFDSRNAVMDKTRWPVNCTLQYLKMGNCTLKQFCVILYHSPNLRTFVLRNGISNDITEPVLKSFPQLTSLSLNDAGICQSLNNLTSILSLTPSLKYLKVVVLISDRPLLNGSEWESVMVTHLPHLNTFESFFSEHNVNNYNPVDYRLLMARYQTAFWVETKQWNVVCTYDPVIHRVIVYSIPMCLTSFTYISRYRKKKTRAPITITNFETDRHLLFKTSMTATTEKKVCLNTKFVILLIEVPHCCDQWSPYKRPCLKIKNYYKQKIF
jgi:hypothetical protein